MLGLAPGPDDVARALAFYRHEAGDPYGWGAVGPDAYDCSGCIGAGLNVLAGKQNPHVRLFATGNLRERAELLGLKEGSGDPDDFRLGVIFPWESRGGIGHIAGTLAGVNVESRGGRGVLVGPAARAWNAPLFRHYFHLPISPLERDAMTKAVVIVKCADQPWLAYYPQTGLVRLLGPHEPTPLRVVHQAAGENPAEVTLTTADYQRFLTSVGREARSDQDRDDA